MGAADLARLLAGKDESPAIALDEASLGDTGPYGPAAYYYLGRWIDSRSVGSSASPDIEARTRLLYRMAFDRAAGLARSEAGLALVARLASAGLWQELLSFSSEYAASLGPAWGSERPRLDALDALDRTSRLRPSSPDSHPHTRTRLPGMRTPSPTSARPPTCAPEANPGQGLSAASCSRGPGRSGRRAPMRFCRPSRGSAASSPRRDPCPGDERRGEPQRLRPGIQGSPARVLRLDGPILLAGDDRRRGQGLPLFLSLKEGEGRFAAVGWTARFYKARFAMALDRPEEAAALSQEGGTEDAPTRADADAALWYAAECRYRAAFEAAGAASPSGATLPSSAGDSVSAKAEAESAARKTALDGLVEASTRWRDPATFSDLVSDLFRDAPARPRLALHRGHGRATGRQARAPTRPAPCRLRGRAGLRASVVEKGGGSEIRYGCGSPRRRRGRSLRGHRGRQIRAAPLPRPRGVARRDRAKFRPPRLFSPLRNRRTAGRGRRSRDLRLGMAAFGLPDMALAEARSRLPLLSDEALRRLAAFFSWLGRPDCGLRLASKLTTRPGYEPRRWTTSSSTLGLTSTRSARFGSSPSFRSVSPWGSCAPRACSARTPSPWPAPSASPS